MKRLFVEPLDVLMFRSERPFVARETHLAKLGIISPLTFEGAIKSKVFIEVCEEKGYQPSDFQRKKSEDEKSFKQRVSGEIEKDEYLKMVLKTIGHPAIESKSTLHVLGVFFSEKEKKMEYFPTPNDLVKKGKNEFLKLKPVLKNEVRIVGTENYPCFSEDSKVESINSLISFDALTDYLHGKEPDKSWFMEEKPYTLEVRTGIELEVETKKTVEGHLYAAEFLRLKENFGFVVWCESPIEVSEGVLRLGGEGKGAICRNIEEINLNEKFRFSNLINEINSKEKKFKLYLASPSYFNGYKPSEKELEKCLGLEKLKLVAALPGKPVYIGGYDFAMNKEKRLQRWVNGGAVYYYKFEGNIRGDLNLPIKVMGENIDMRCAFIGRW